MLGMVLISLQALTSSAAPAGDLILPTPVTPEPYPFSGRYPAVIYLDSVPSLQLLYSLQIEFEGLHPVKENQPTDLVDFQASLATVYINPAEAALLLNLGLEAIPIPNEGLRSFYEYGPGSDAPNAWPTFEEFVARMQGLESNYPTLTDLVSIGTSVQGRDIWCLSISDHIDQEEDEPEFKYSSSIHGDETTGIELTLRLAELLLENYGIDPDLTRLVDEIEIWLCPIHNPDGYVSGDRYNAYGYDLNRNFPDRFTGPSDDLQLENQAFINLGKSQRFVMGANYHGGELVFNYPWDAVVAPGDPIVPDYAPDDNLFHDLGLGYTTRNPMIYYGGFPQGLTRGWEWYQIWGGMQDYVYVWNGEHHVTIEVSDIKRPDYGDMDTYWDNNEESMLWWLEASLTGVRGLVLDAHDGSPISATITINDLEFPNFARTDPLIGDYHRVIAAGNYTLTAVATDFQSLSHQVTIEDGSATHQDFLLCHSDPWTVSGSVTQAVSGLPLEASIEFLDSPQKTFSNPVDGLYNIEICPETYIMRVSAPHHYAQERQVIVDQDLTEDFSLVPYEQPPDLSGSLKLVSSQDALPGNVLQYQIVMINNGAPTTVTLTDTLPISLTWTGELTATRGTPVFADGQILWQDTLTQGETVTVTYAASPDQCLPVGTQLTNIAVLRDHFGVLLERAVTVNINNSAPEVPNLLNPPDGAINQPQELSLTWASSGDANCDTLVYDVYFGLSTPPPLAASGLLETIYTPQELQPHDTYYWYISASDGITQTQSPLWQFTTLNHAPDMPIPIYPVDASTELPTSLVLSWSGGDLDNDALTYTLTFWTQGEEPLIITGLIDSLYNPGMLNPGVTYYWQISVSDGFDITDGVVWSFTTQPIRHYLPLARKTSNQEP
jgi:carboxypeptidase D